MTLPLFWNDVPTAAVVTHLWQSTAFMCIAWLLALALRKYPARVRFAVWMTASVKFLVPFALLTSLGAHLTKAAAQPQRRMFYTIIEQIGRPFATENAPTPVATLPAHSAHASSWLIVLLAGVWLVGCFVMLSRWLVQWSRARRIVRDASPLLECREVMALRRAESEADRRKPIPVLLASKAIEPGIFGIVRPVLLWPAGLSERLDDAQIQAIVVHELEHVRRRDNLTAAMQAVIEALFWFHPGVHWMGAKMTEDRELACDERVIEQSAEPQKYAESILKVCAFCFESPLQCVSGVSGSDLKMRVLRILRSRSGATLTFGWRVSLISLAVLTLTLPIGLGAVRGQAAPASNASAPDSGAPGELPKYDVASIKPAADSQGGLGPRMLQLTPDGTIIRGLPVQMLLQEAFNSQADRILGAPSWVKSNRYDIEAKIAPEDASKLEKLKAEDRNRMLIPLLVERFNLKYHHETRELPMYALVVAKGGPKLTESKATPAADHDAPGSSADFSKGPGNQFGRMMMNPGHIEAEGSPVSLLARSLAPQIGHTVVDKTGLTGKYDFALQWTPDNAPPPMLGGQGAGAARPEASNDAPDVSLFTALQEQLGLKLEPEKSSVDVIVIDHIDPPSAN
jgi:uncharacterized protein (TIGR03435 family)